MVLGDVLDATMSRVGPCRAIDGFLIERVRPDPRRVLIGDGNPDSAYLRRHLSWTGRSLILLPEPSSSDTFNRMHFARPPSSLYQTLRLACSAPVAPRRWRIVWAAHRRRHR